MDERIELDQRHPTKYWHALPDGRIQCDLCQHDCKLHEGQRGLCFVRGQALEGGTTFCPACQHPLITRDWYDIRHYDLSPHGSCPKCGTVIAGHFRKFTQAFGKKRVPVFVPVHR